MLYYVELEDAMSGIFTSVEKAYSAMKKVVEEIGGIILPLDTDIGDDTWYNVYVKWPNNNEFSNYIIDGCYVDKPWIS